ncbi:hypothetical protein [Pseudobdellovibrio exovorus]|nr:hypothetical protein [Pseudobdellovibrio exovorus]
MKPLLFIAFALILASCTKKNPNPELSDAIYMDLQEELSIADKALEEETKNLASLQKEKDAVVPQTGQVKYALKKVEDSLAKIDRLKQQKQFFEISLETRKHLVAERYEESLTEGGRPWPDEAEIADYRAIIKIQREKIAYDKVQGMRKYVPRGTTEPASAPSPSKH